MTFRTAYGEKIKSSISDFGDGLTEQSHKKECDINQIVNRFKKTGVLTHARNYAGQYGIATAMEFQDAMETVTQAQKMFDDLPSHLRTRFGNDPASFLDFVQNPDNTAEMKKMGLLVGDAGSPLAGDSPAPATGTPGNTVEPPTGDSSTTQTPTG